MSKLEYGTGESGEEILMAMLHTYRLLPDPSRLVVKVGASAGEVLKLFERPCVFLESLLFYL